MFIIFYIMTNFKLIYFTEIYKKTFQDFSRKVLINIKFERPPLQISKIYIIQGINDGYGNIKIYKQNII